MGRTCLGLGARLHIVKPMQFTIDDKKIKRAGLDYWHSVNEQPLTWLRACVCRITHTPSHTYTVLLSRGFGRVPHYTSIVLQLSRGFGRVPHYTHHTYTVMHSLSRGFGRVPHYTYTVLQ